MCFAEEVHAELIYAELQVMQTLLTFFGDQNLIAMIKGAFKMRSANSTYKYCLDVQAHRTSWTSEVSKSNFESGVAMGNGTLQLVISHLPTRILKLLAIAGFSGDRDVAIKELHRATEEFRTSARYKVAEMVVECYNLYIEQMFGKFTNEKNQQGS